MMKKRKNAKYQDDVIHRPIRSANSSSTQQYGMDKKSSKTVTKKAATIFKFLGLCVAAFTLFFKMSTRTLEKKVSEAVNISPFKMPIQGDKFSIFQPLYDMDDAEKDAQIFGNTKDILSTFKKRIEWASTLIHDKNNVKPASVEEHAQSMYFEMIKNHVSALVFNNAELTVVAKLGSNQILATLDPVKRKQGRDWTFVGDTMGGEMRLDNVKDLILDVVKENVKGDYIETGVWRGGSSVFARAVLTALGEEKNRVSYVCDSFAGLPPGEKKLDKEDAGWDSTPYLEVPSSIVANNFIKYGLLDSNVIFAKGFFNETMPPLSEKIQSLSIMRLDVSFKLNTFF